MEKGGLETRLEVLMTRPLLKNGPYALDRISNVLPSLHLGRKKEEGPTEEGCEKKGTEGKPNGIYEFTPFGKVDTSSSSGTRMTSNRERGIKVYATTTQKKEKKKSSLPSGSCLNNAAKMGDNIFSFCRLWRWHHIRTHLPLFR